MCWAGWVSVVVLKQMVRSTLLKLHVQVTVKVDAAYISLHSANTCGGDTCNTEPWTPKCPLASGRGVVSLPAKTSLIHSWKDLFNRLFVYQQEIIVVSSERGKD